MKRAYFPDYYKSKNYCFSFQTIFEIGSTSKSTAQSVMMSKRCVNIFVSWYSTTLDY